MKHQELFDKYWRRELSAAEMLQLKQLLAHDVEAGRALVGYVNETALLVRVGSQIESASAGENIVPLKSAPPPRAFSWKWAAVLVGLCAITTMMLVATRPRPATGPQLVATGAGVQITRGVQEMSAAGDVELRAGDVITTSTNNTATIRYPGEATRILIQPGSLVEFKDSSGGKQFELLRGGLSASVAPQATNHAMLIITPHARATVLGTEFALRTDDLITKLDVLEGTVLFTCRINAKKVTVTGGFSSVSDRGGPTTVVPLQSTAKP